VAVPGRSSRSSTCIPARDAGEFEVVNTTDRPITGQAIPSYGRSTRRSTSASSTASASRSRRCSRARRARCRSCSSSTRRAARARHDHAVVHVLRSRGPRQAGRRRERLHDAPRITGSQDERSHHPGHEAVLLRPAAVELSDQGIGLRCC
jgi:hypothetical protein